jgi:hypothetical protein
MASLEGEVGQFSNKKFFVSKKTAIPKLDSQNCLLNNLKEMSI